MKKLLALVLALVMAMSCVVFASAEEATSIAVCLSSEPDTLDPALNSAVDGATMLAHLFSGLATWSTDENGKLVIVAECAQELTEGVVNEDGTVTYTYTLKDGLTWSDGQPLTANDFVFAWKRAASTALGADYGYMFEVVKGYPDELAVEATDDKTIVVTLTTPWLTGTSCWPSPPTSPYVKTWLPAKPGLPKLPPMSAMVPTPWLTGLTTA